MKNLNQIAYWHEQSSGNVLAGKAGCLWANFIRPINLMHQIVPRCPAPYFTFKLKKKFKTTQKNNGRSGIFESMSAWRQRRKRSGAEVRRRQKKRRCGSTTTTTSVEKEVVGEWEVLEEKETGKILCIFFQIMNMTRGNIWSRWLIERTIFIGRHMTFALQSQPSIFRNSTT
jgi:hypothetical protein